MDCQTKVLKTDERAKFVLGRSERVLILLVFIMAGVLQEPTRLAQLKS